MLLIPNSRSGVCVSPRHYGGPRFEG